MAVKCLVVVVVGALCPNPAHKGTIWTSCSSGHRKHGGFGFPGEGDEFCEHEGIAGWRGEEPLWRPGGRADQGSGW